MERKSEFKIIIIDSNGLNASGNDSTTLLESIRNYNKTFRKIDSPRRVDGMFGFELANQGNMVFLNGDYTPDEGYSSTIYVPRMITQSMEEYAMVAYELIAGYEKVKLESDIHKVNGVFHSKSEVRVGPDARNILVDHLASLKKEEGEKAKQKQLTL